MSKIGSSRPAPRAGVLNISAYTPGKTTANYSGPVYKLSSNETPLGASEHALDAYRANAVLEHYPDPSALALREAIADVHGLNSSRLVIGNGSDELLSLLAYGYLSDGDEAIYSEHGFLVYPIAIEATGATPVIARETNLHANVDNILQAVTPKTKIVFLANPNNPTGTYLPFDEVKRLHTELPSSVLLVLDAAYAEYVRKNDYESGIELVANNENVVMTRTFSKIYGLANLRLGWIYAPEHIVDVLHRIRGPFNVSGAAQAAGVAAIKDRGFIENAVAFNSKWLPWLEKQLTGLGLVVTPSVGNFLLMHFPDIDGKRAIDADQFLLDRGYVLRLVGNYGFPNSLRASLGKEKVNRGLVDAIREFMEQSV